MDGVHDEQEVMDNALQEGLFPCACQETVMNYIMHLINNGTFGLQKEQLAMTESRKAFDDRKKED